MAKKIPAPKGSELKAATRKELKEGTEMVDSNFKHGVGYKGQHMAWENRLMDKVADPIGKNNTRFAASYERNKTNERAKANQKQEGVSDKVDAAFKAVGKNKPTEFHKHLAERGVK